MSNTAAPHIVTANDLTSGHVVYLGTDGAWVSEIARARVAHSQAELTEMSRIAAEQSLAVIDPYAITIDSASGEAPRPVELRERRRARGPSARAFTQIPTGRGIAAA